MLIDKVVHLVFSYGVSYIHRPKPYLENTYMYKSTKHNTYHVPFMRRLEYKHACGVTLFRSLNSNRSAVYLGKDNCINLTSMFISIMTNFTSNELFANEESRMHEREFYIHLKYFLTHLL